MDKMNLRVQTISLNDFAITDERNCPKPIYVPQKKMIILALNRSYYQTSIVILHSLTFKRLKQFVPHKREVRSIKFIQNRYLVTCSSQYRLTLWDSEKSFQCYLSFELNMTCLTAELIPESMELAVGGLFDGIKFIDLKNASTNTTSPKLRKFDIGKDSVQYLCYWEKYKLLVASTQAQRTILFINPLKNELIHKFQYSTDLRPCKAMEFSFTDEALYCLSSPHHLFKLAAQAGEPLKFTAHIYNEKDGKDEIMDFDVVGAKEDILMLCYHNSKLKIQDITSSSPLLARNINSEPTTAWKAWSSRRFKADLYACLGSRASRYELKIVNIKNL